MYSLIIKYKIMNNEKTQEKTADEKPVEIKKDEVVEEKKAPLREILIQTDGNSINIVRADVAGNLELVAILSTIINKINVK